MKITETQAEERDQIEADMEDLSKEDITEEDGSSRISEMIRSRLGICEVCSGDVAKYTCPRCSIHTCSVRCSKIHKEEIECSGQRNKTAYKPLKDFNDLDVLSDYRMLEEIGRSVDTCKRDSTRKVTRIGQELTVHLHKLRAACFKRNTRIRFMPSVMIKHKENTTRLDWRTNEISWRVSWRVPQLGVSFVDEKFPEDNEIGATIEEHLSQLKSLENTGEDLKEQIDFLIAGGRSSLRILMPAEMQYKYSGK
ncbi:hypothetical protein QYM36_007522 [Artemia franciscana]|nr:hypothetical protein QYM36_007522 [Artemia franciscana]